MNPAAELPALVRKLQETDEPQGLGDDLADEMYMMNESATAAGIREGKRIGWDSDAWSEMAEPVAPANDEVRIDASTLRDAAELQGTSMKDSGELPLVLTVARAAREMGLKVPAFRTRIQRGQVSGVVRTGTKIEIDRDRFLAGLTRSKRGRGRQ